MQAELLQNARAMIKRISVFLLFLASTASAQSIDPLRNVAGTSANPGPSSAWVRSASGAWSTAYALSGHLTWVTETGPDDGRSEVFSTNWLAMGAERVIGNRGFFLVRGRVSAEPFSVPEEGYPQMLQYQSPQSGGPAIDSMRAHDLIGEAAIQAGFRPSESTLLHLYVAGVGDPALGPPPAHLRNSGLDFAEAPYSYDIAESFYDSTSVVTAGFVSRVVSLEASVFHDAITTGDHTDFDDGDIDSQSARLTFTPGENFSMQISRGELGEDLEKRDITSASFSYGSGPVNATALWTQREQEERESETAYGFEIALRGGNNTFMGRAEWVDRPEGFPEELSPLTRERTTHFAVGYIYDFYNPGRYRGGIGVNIDYHTQSHDLPERYGHKPQAIYTFVRLRTGN